MYFSALVLFAVRLAIEGYMHRISTEVYQFLQASAPTLILAPDSPKFTIIYANPAYYRVTGTKPDDILNHGFLDAFPDNPANPGSVGILRAKLIQCVERKRETVLPAERYDIPIRGTSNFSTRYWQAANNPVLDATGEVSYIIHTTVDITPAFELAKKQQIAKEVAERSHENLLNLIMQAPVAMCILTGPGYILETANTKALEFLGIDERNIGKPVFEGVPQVEEEFKPLMDEVFFGGKTLHFEEKAVNLRRNGKLEPLFVNFSYQPFVENEVTTGVLGIAIDVTNQVLSRQVIESSHKATQELNEELTSINEELEATNEEMLSARQKAEQAETQLRLALEGGHLGSWYMLTETKDFHYNERLAEIYGYEAEVPMTFEAVFEQINEEERPKIQEQIDLALATGNIYDVTFPLRRFNDGRLIWIRALGKVSKSEGGGNDIFAGIAMDITEQKQDEQRKNDFIAMVSHELKTPLTSMQAYVQMLLSKIKKTDDGFSIRALEQANRQVRKMTVMVNGFLNVSRLEAGKIRIDKKLFNMADLVKEVEDEVRSSVSSHKVVFEPVLLTMVTADRDKIGQVIQNFISNAVKYSPSQSTIQVACVTVDGHVQVSVRDEGKGIRPEDRERLFDRYYRVQDETTNNVSGFGIGLYLSAEIIHRHNGKIWLDSEPGKGSTFYFGLPC